MKHKTNTKSHLKAAPPVKRAEDPAWRRQQSSASSFAPTTMETVCTHRHVAPHGVFQSQLTSNEMASAMEVAMSTLVEASQLYRRSGRCSAPSGLIRTTTRRVSSFRA
jgi:hypothetical protein